MKVKNYTKVNNRNMRTLFLKPNGNLYFRRLGDTTFQVLEGWGLDELKEGFSYGDIEMIWIEGPSLGDNVEVEEN